MVNGEAAGKRGGCNGSVSEADEKAMERQDFSLVSVVIAHRVPLCHVPDRSEVSAGEVDDVYVVAHAGAVGRVVVRSKDLARQDAHQHQYESYLAAHLAYLDLLSPSLQHLGHDRHQVGRVGRVLRPPPT